MVSLQLYNSLTKQREAFHPLQRGKVRIYNCGPTVYKRQHIGNMRRFLFADFLRRTLELLGYEVKDITNITDVGHLTEDDRDSGEDKLEKAARESSKSPQEIAEQQTKLFYQDLSALNIKPAHLYPRASQHIAEMQSLIKQLIATGHAYTTTTGVYFAVESFSEYGKLSGNRLSALVDGSRVPVREEKRHPADFALWKLDNTHLQKWDSPWGVGYPGWHIECSAMSLKYFDSDIDIHTGGEDNRFPHHENEIAQSEAATGKHFVRVWMHNAHLQLQGKKLAKREGEQITLDTIVEKGFSPLAFRLLAFSAHYRHTLDFSWDALADAQKHIETIKNTLRRFPALVESGTPDDVNAPLAETFGNALADDLNTPEALAVFLAYLKQINSKLDTNPPEATQRSLLATLYHLDLVVGVVKPLAAELANETVPPEIQKLVDERERARAARDFSLADELRQKIEQLGYKIDDTETGPRIYSSSQ